MVDNSAELPLDIYFMIPSCIPATQLESSGAQVHAADMQTWIDHPRVLGVGEMMNFPGVLFQDPEVLAKLKISGTKRIDGHAPLLRGFDLSAYIATGISSDHETSQLSEAQEKLDKGMFLMIREGSAARNLETLLPVLNTHNSRFCGFVTDDRHPDTLMDEGHINFMIKTAISKGIDPITALQLATINTARHFQIPRTGALTPGFRADLVVFDNFTDFNILKVYKDGQLVAENGSLVGEIRTSNQTEIPNSVNFKPLSENAFTIPARGKQIRAIKVISNQVLTGQVILEATLQNGQAVADPSKDLCKIAIIERHRRTGNLFTGFVKGMELQRGALASTVAHDSHNLIVVGCSDQDMLFASTMIQQMKGGQVVVLNGEMLAFLPLPIAGLLSDQSLKQVRNASEALLRAAKRLGCLLPNPFMTLSFLALPVIPELKITDCGLVDVRKFDFVDLFVDQDQA
jgi:adenine deaminase